MTASKGFLDDVARYLLSLGGGLADLTLVFPNKRSALFLKKYIHDLLISGDRVPRFMPRFTTMANFISRFAPYPEMTRTEQLFLLYDCYRRILLDRGREDQLRDFDKFVFWGNIILDDFDDIDRQLADVAMLFSNLRNLKEINADYLDDDQKDIVRRLWGDAPRNSSSLAAGFWSHIGYPGSDASPASRFLNLWEILDELYDSFTAALHRRGYDTPGGQYRQAAAAVSALDHDTLASRRCAFIGFDILTASETLVFKRFRDAGQALFFWDFDTPLLDLGLDPALSRYFRNLLREFPMPAGFEPSPCNALPRVRVVAVPSSSAQTKVAGSMLASRPAASAALIRSAIVVPDDSLLIPLLLSIPPQVRSVNITMGVPFDSTAFASMLRSVISMQLRARSIRGSIHYYYADVIELLSHPHLSVIAPREAEEIKRAISKNNLFNIDASKLCGDYPGLAYIFTPVKGIDSPDGICSYMESLLDGISEALGRNARGNMDGLPEAAMLAHFKEEISTLNGLINSYGVTVGETTYFSIFERILRSTRIDMEGTPLRGLQVMGVLETRGIDFDDVTILSVNENTFPRKNRLRTMIPNNLRTAYGLTTVDLQEQRYAYYFYRLLSRASRATLIYDSRTGSLGAGEPSRYIAQLTHLLPPEAISTETFDFRSDFNAPLPITVAKTPAVLRQLDYFREGGGGFLSASALKDYKRCRLRFYLKYVRNLRGDDEITDYITAAAYGSIVHKVVETLFAPYENRAVDAAVLDSFLTSPGMIERCVDAVIHTMFYNRPSGGSSSDATLSIASLPAVELPAEGAVTATVITHYIRRMLEIERDAAPFVYIKGEMKVQSPPAWKISDRLSVNFKMSVDRVDEIAPGHLRFIDFKTGGDKAQPVTMDKLFVRGRHDDDAVFQLLTYCIAYRDLVDPSAAIRPVVYPFRIMAATGAVPPTVVDGCEIDDYRTVAGEFARRLFDMIEEIFSEEVPFDQTDDPADCAFCPFLDLCSRSVPEY